MRTHPNFLRQGVAATLLEHIIAVAHARGYRRLSLETGSGPGFEAAFLGFEPGPLSLKPDEFWDDLMKDTSIVALYNTLPDLYPGVCGAGTAIVDCQR